MLGRNRSRVAGVQRIEVAEDKDREAARETKQKKEKNGADHVQISE